MLSQILICCSFHWRQYLIAPPGYFFSPCGSTWSMTVNFPAPRQSSLTTQPSWFWYSSIPLSTKMRNCTQPKIGSVWLNFVINFFNYFLSVETLLNSFGSVLSYNTFDLEPIFAARDENKKCRKIKKTVWHEPTFVKQLIYFLIFTALNLG